MFIRSPLHGWSFKKHNYFCCCFVWGAIIGCTQGLLLALPSGIIPGVLGETIWGIRDQNRLISCNKSTFTAVLLHWPQETQLFSLNPCNSPLSYSMLFCFMDKNYLRLRGEKPPLSYMGYDSLGICTYCQVSHGRQTFSEVTGPVDSLTLVRLSLNQGFPVRPSKRAATSRSSQRFSRMGRTSPGPSITLGATR